jgi:glycosyltransferase involved in cell wall biosynthesis
VRSPLNLVLVISSLGCGGAERVVQLLAAGFQEQGHTVTVITTTEREDFFPLPEGVRRVSLNVFGRPTRCPDRRARPIPALFRATRTLPRLREAILSTAPHLVISFGDEINLLVLMVLFPNCRQVAVTEHVNPQCHRRNAILRLLRRLLYPRARCLVSVSRGIDACFDWLPAARRTVIHNPVALEQETAAPRLPAGTRSGQYVVAMGRQVFQKGFDLLLDAFVEVNRAFPEWKLIVLGDGPDRGELIRRADALGIGESAHFLGAVRNPAPYLSSAGFFVMSSRFEGFGNVLVEAMACGLPVVSFDCPSGPAEIVDDCANGLLVAPQDTVALAQAMKRMIADAPMRREMAQRAKADARRFGLPSIVEAWERQVLRRVG